MITSNKKVTFPRMFYGYVTLPAIYILMKIKRMQ